MKKAWYVLAPAAVLGVVANAQNSDKVGEIPVEELKVWGTAVKASSVYMGGEDISIKQADHISDLLRTIPGVDVGGAHSLNQRITIRSVEDRDIRISIDGANQNNYMYHHMGNLQIHADILQAVDIEVGTNSVVNGGLGGSVRFETRTASDLLANGRQFGGRIKLSASDNASDDLALAVYGETNNGLDLLAYYNRISKDNFVVGGGEIRNGAGEIVGDTNGEVRGLEGDVNSALIKAGWKVSETQGLELAFESYEDSGSYSYRPDMGLATDLSISENGETPLLWPTEYTRDTLTLNYEASLGATEIRAAIYDNSSSLWRDERALAQSSNARISGGAGVIDGTADSKGVNLIANTNIGSNISNELTYGLEHIDYSTNFNGSYLDDSEVSSAEEKSDLAIYVQDRIQLTPLISIIPGLRYDKVDIDSVVVEDSFSATSFALALEVQPSDNFVVKLSSTELFQAPELSEVFLGGGIYDTPNPNITEESGLNNELSLALSEEKISLGVTFFSTQINSFIYDYAAPDPANPRAVWKDNIGDMKIKGYEFYTGFNNEGFGVLLSHSSAESELSAFQEYSHYDGARMDRSQGDSMALSLSYDFQSTDVSFNWDWIRVDDLGAVDASLQLDGGVAAVSNHKPGHEVHNISFNWKPLEDLKVIFGVDNLLDEYYVNQSSRIGETFHPLFGFLSLDDFEPGRNVKATVEYKF